MKERADFEFLAVEIVQTILCYGLDHEGLDKRMVLDALHLAGLQTGLGELEDLPEETHLPPEPPTQREREGERFRALIAQRRADAARIVQHGLGLGDAES